MPVHRTVALSRFDARAHWRHDRDESQAKGELPSLVALVAAVHDEVKRVIRQSRAWIQTPMSSPQMPAVPDGSDRVAGVRKGHQLNDVGTTGPS